MRLDVSHVGSGDASEAIQGRDLVDDVVGQPRGFNLDGASTKAGQVVIANLGTDDHSTLGRLGTHPAQDVGVARVESAGHVGAGDDPQQGFVVAEGPDAEPLAEITVEIDGRAHRELSPVPARRWADSSLTSGLLVMAPTRRIARTVQNTGQAAQMSRTRYLSRQITGRTQGRAALLLSAPTAPMPTTALPRISTPTNPRPA